MSYRACQLAKLQYPGRVLAWSKSASFTASPQNATAAISLVVLANPVTRLSCRRPRRTRSSRRHDVCRRAERLGTALGGRDDLRPQHRRGPLPLRHPGSSLDPRSRPPAAPVHVGGHDCHGLADPTSLPQPGADCLLSPGGRLVRTRGRRATLHPRRPNNQLLQRDNDDRDGMDVHADERQLGGLHRSFTRPCAGRFGTDAYRRSVDARSADARPRPGPERGSPRRTGS